MRFEPKYSFVILVVLESSLSDSHEVSLSEPLELLVEDLYVPDLIGLVDYAAL